MEKYLQHDEARDETNKYTQTPQKRPGERAKIWVCNLIMIAFHNLND